jgi:hypothetical protein
MGSSAASAGAFVLALCTTIGFPCCTAMRIDEIALKVFLENRFGRAYAKQETGAFHQHFGGLGR